MSVVASLRTAAGAEVRTTSTTTGARPTRGRTSPKTKRALVVAVSLLVLAALLAALIPASEAPNNAEHSSSSFAGTTHDRSGAAGAPVSQPGAPQMSEEEALDAYAKL